MMDAGYMHYMSDVWLEPFPHNKSRKSMHCLFIFGILKKHFPNY